MQGSTIEESPRIFSRLFQATIFRFDLIDFLSRSDSSHHFQKAYSIFFHLEALKRFSLLAFSFRLARGFVCLTPNKRTLYGYSFCHAQVRQTF